MNSKLQVRGNYTLSLLRHFLPIQVPLQWSPPGWLHCTQLQLHPRVHDWSSQISGPTSNCKPALCEQEMALALAFPESFPALLPVISNSAETQTSKAEKGLVRHPARSAASKVTPWFKLPLHILALTPSAHFSSRSQQSLIWLLYLSVSLLWKLHGQNYTDFCGWFLLLAIIFQIYPHCSMCQ